MVNAEDDRAVPTAERTAVRNQIVKPTEKEIALYARRKPIEPGFAYGPDLVSRMFNARTLSAAVVMMFGIAIMAGLMRILDTLRPAL